MNDLIKIINNDVELGEIRQNFNDMVAESKAANASSGTLFKTNNVKELFFFEAKNYKGEKKSIGEWSKKADINFVHFDNPISVVESLSMENPNSFEDGSYEWGGKEYAFDQKSWNLEILVQIDNDSPIINIFNNFSYLDYFISVDKEPEEFREGEDIYRITSLDEAKIFNASSGKVYWLHAQFQITPIKVDYPNVQTKTLQGVVQEEVLKNNELKIKTRQPIYSIDTFSKNLDDGNQYNDKTILVPDSEESKTFGNNFENLRCTKASSFLPAFHSSNNFWNQPSNKTQLSQNFFQGGNYVAMPMNITKNSNEEVRFYSRWFDSVKSMNPFWLSDKDLKLNGGSTFSKDIFQNSFKESLTWGDIKKILGNNKYLIRTFQAVKTVCDARIQSWYGAPAFKLDASNPDNNTRKSLNSWVTAAQDKNDAEFGVLVDDFIIKPAKINAKRSTIIGDFTDNGELVQWVGETTEKSPDSSDWNRFYGLISAMTDSMFSTYIDDNFSPYEKHTLINGFTLTSKFALPSITGNTEQRNFVKFDSSYWEDDKIFYQLSSKNFQLKKIELGTPIIKTEANAKNAAYVGQYINYGSPSQKTERPWEKDTEKMLYKYNNAINMRKVKNDIYGIGKQGSTEKAPLSQNSVCGIFLGKAVPGITSSQKKLKTTSVKSLLLEKVESENKAKEYGQGEPAASSSMKGNTIPKEWASELVAALPISLNYFGFNDWEWERSVYQTPKFYGVEGCDVIFENQYFFGDAILVSDKRTTWRRTEQSFNKPWTPKWDSFYEQGEDLSYKRLTKPVQDYSLRFESLGKAEKGWFHESWFLDIPFKTEIESVFNSLTDEAKKDFKENFKYEITFASWYWDKKAKPEQRTGGVVWTRAEWSSSYKTTTTDKIKMVGNMVLNNDGAYPLGEADNTSLIVHNPGSTMEDIIKINERNGEASLTNDDYYWTFLTTSQWYYLYSKMRQNHFEEMDTIHANRSNSNRIEWRANKIINWSTSSVDYWLNSTEFYKSVKTLTNTNPVKPFLIWDEFELPYAIHNLKFVNKDGLDSFSLGTNEFDKNYFENKELAKMKLGIIGNGQTKIDFGGGLTYNIEQSNAYEERANEVQWWIEF